MNSVVCRVLRPAFQNLSLLPQASAGFVPRRAVSWRSDDDFRHPNNINNNNWFGILKENKMKRNKEWQKYNEAMYTPREPNTEERPAEVCYGREDIMCSRKNLWQTGIMLTGLSVEEAAKQLAHRPDQVSRIWEEILSEAVELAVKKHNVEFATNLWIEHVSVKRGGTMQRLYKGPRRSFTLKKVVFADAWLRLREGPPPKFYHPKEVNRGWGTGFQMMDKELAQLRRRRVRYGL